MKIAFYTMLAFGLLITGTYSIAQPLQTVRVEGGVLRKDEHQIFIKDFQVTAFEITNQQYAFFLNKKEIWANGMLNESQLINAGDADLQLEFTKSGWRAKAGKENYPMVMVSYIGAIEYCKWRGATLPTEIQWQHAASGGAKSKHYIFAGGNNLDEVGWYKANSGQRAHEVGKKKPNELGIYDMSGNAGEWCLDDTFKTGKGIYLYMGGSCYSGAQPARIDAHYSNTTSHFSNDIGFRAVFPADEILHLKDFSQDYKGRSWNDKPQQIPGKIQCEWYDLGGEGIAYHDKDSINNGSGKLNPANGSLMNEFRMKEGVDISYTKANDIDNNPYNTVQPMMDQFYTGWTEPGEWINYTVTVNETGKYSIGLMYTASGDGSIALWLDGKKLTRELVVPSTRNAKETVAWRQWHHWNKIHSLTFVHLKKGTHVLTIQTVTNGNMNYDYLDFKLIK